MIEMSDFQSDLSRNNIPKSNVIYQHIKVAIVTNGLKMALAIITWPSI